MKGLFQLFLTCCWLGLVAPQALAATPTPLEVVQQTSSQVIERVKRDKEQLRADPMRLSALVDELVFPHFDFERMGRFVLGKNWNGASEDQRSRFVQEFRGLLTRTYATALLEYSDRAINYLPATAEPDGRQATVRSEIEQPGAQPVPLSYRMHLTDDGWKVYDVSVEGVSLISTYRSSFAQEVRQGGIQGLIDSLAARNAGKVSSQAP